MPKNNSEILTDQKLMELIRENDVEAYKTLYNRYWKILFCTASKKLKNNYIAEEITQDIFANLWLRRKKIRITTSLSSYLFVSLKYKTIDFLAKEYSRIKYNDYLLRNYKESENYIDNWLFFVDLNEKLEKSIRILPQKCQLIYQLSKEKGYKNKEIARELGISEKTVEAHLTRAFKTLRRKLASYL